MSWGQSKDEEVYMDRYYNLIYPKGSTHLDGVDNEILEITDPHWGTFPPQHPLAGHLVAIAYAVLWAINFFGNGVVIYIFLKVRTLRSSSNIFVVNLAVSDILMMITQAPPVIINAFYQRYWMWGKLGCELYAMTGAITGVCSIMTMIVIGYDRYNVIVKGLAGKKISPAMAFVMLVFIWTYSIGIQSAPMLGWGQFKIEGLLISCSYDFLTPELNQRTFLLFAYIFNYFVPMMMIAMFYISIVKAVVAHEAALKAQAKKMNVDSLRSGGESDESAEMKIAKVAITNVLLWFCIWTPYAVVSALPVLGLQAHLTPLVAALPGFLAKCASCINPIVYAVSHPKFREAIAKELPCLGIGDKPKEQGNKTQATEGA